MEAQTFKITEETLIGGLVEEHPEVIDTLLGYGVHCIGCGVSPYESIGDGFRSHGMSEEEVQEAIAQLNKVIVNQPQTTPVKTVVQFTVTPAAALKIKDFCDKNQKQALRVSIKRGGCSGYSYVLELVDQKKDHDISIMKSGARLYIDGASAEQLDGAEIDYIDSLQGAGFKIKNPQATKGCGCGNSFGI